MKIYKNLGISFFLLSYVFHTSGMHYMTDRINTLRNNFTGAGMMQWGGAAAMVGVPLIFSNPLIAGAPIAIYAGYAYMQHRDQIIENLRKELLQKLGEVSGEIEEVSGKIDRLSDNVNSTRNELRDETRQTAKEVMGHTQEQIKHVLGDLKIVNTNLTNMINSEFGKTNEELQSIKAFLESQNNVLSQLKTDTELAVLKQSTELRASMEKLNENFVDRLGICKDLLNSFSQKTEEEFKAVKQSIVSLEKTLTVRLDNIDTTVRRIGDTQDTLHQVLINLVTQQSVETAKHEEQKREFQKFSEDLLNYQEKTDKTLYAHGQCLKTLQQTMDNLSIKVDRGVEGTKDDIHKSTNTILTALGKPPIPKDNQNDQQMVVSCPISSKTLVHKKKKQTIPENVDTYIVNVDGKPRAIAFVPLEPYYPFIKEANKFGSKLGRSMTENNYRRINRNTIEDSVDITANNGILTTSWYLNNSRLQNFNINPRTNYFNLLAYSRTTISKNV